jgi:hypothetical protein
VQRTGVENDASCGSSQIIILDVTYIDGSNHFFFSRLGCRYWCGLNNIVDVGQEFRLVSKMLLLMSGLVLISGLLTNRLVQEQSLPLNKEVY